jgi:hypothetical protein
VAETSIIDRSGVGICIFYLEARGDDTLLVRTRRLDTLNKSPSADIWFSVKISQVLNEYNFSLLLPIYKISSRYITSGNLTNIASFQIKPSGYLYLKACRNSLH